MQAALANSQDSRMPSRSASLTLSQLPHGVTLYKHLIFKYKILNKITLIKEYFIKTFFINHIFFEIN